MGMTRRVWACEDCGREWPLVTEPPEVAECDNCGGPIEQVAPSLVAAMDLIEEVVASTPKRGQITSVTVNGRTYPVDPPVPVEGNQRVTVTYLTDAPPSVSVHVSEP